MNKWMQHERFPWNMEKILTHNEEKKLLIQLNWMSKNVQHSLIWLEKLLKITFIPYFVVYYMYLKTVDIKPSSKHHLIAVQVENIHNDTINLLSVSFDRFLKSKKIGFVHECVIWMRCECLRCVIGVFCCFSHCSSCLPIGCIYTCR